MEKITDVIIDLDGVVYPFADAFKHYCVRALNLNPKTLDYPTRWEFYEDWGMTREEFDAHLIQATIDHNLYATMIPEYHADYAWQVIRDLKLTLHVVTFRPIESQDQTRQWLDDHNLTPDHLWFPTTSKGDVIKEIGGKSIAIEDNVDYALDMQQAGATVLLRTQPWNSGHTELLRVDNLRSFAQVINHLTNEEYL
jgi:hypothetical protein